MAARITQHFDSPEQETLARRFVWRAAWPLTLVWFVAPALMFAVIVLQFVHRGAVPIGSWLGLLGGLIPAFTITMQARGQVRALHERGIALTEEMVAARPARTFVSPLDPFATFELCADRLSSIGMAAALGYARPAAFRHDPYRGRIVIGPTRPFWYGGAIAVTIGMQGGERAQVRVQYRPGMLQIMRTLGEAIGIVDRVCAELRHALDTRRAALDAAVRARELERSVLQAKLHALQAQVEPHFLYNTLANLKYLIRADAGRGEQLVDHLVGYFQAALPDMRMERSTVGRELDLAEHYLSLMRIRMGERLAFRIDADPHVLDRPVPPAMLISLVENAVEHGLERADRPGRIEVACRADGPCVEFSVRDDGAGLDDAAAGDGVGLANIHQRLRLLFGTAASLRVEPNPGGGVLARLRIPVPHDNAA